jgi:hypothetical protein
MEKVDVGTNSTPELEKIFKDRGSTSGGGFCTMEYRDKGIISVMKFRDLYFS